MEIVIFSILFIASFEANQSSRIMPHPYTINRILKKVARAAGVAEGALKHLSGHSMRVGAAQDMIASGLSILPIMQAGGWKTVNVVSRYVENANLSALLESARETRPQKSEARLGSLRGHQRTFDHRANWG